METGAGSSWLCSPQGTSLGNLCFPFSPSWEEGVTVLPSRSGNSFQNIDLHKMLSAGGRRSHGLPGTRVASRSVPTLSPPSGAAEAECTRAGRPPKELLSRCPSLAPANQRDQGPVPSHLYLQRLDSLSLQIWGGCVPWGLTSLLDLRN